MHIKNFATALTMSALLGLTFSACGDSSSTGPDSPEEASSSSKKTTSSSSGAKSSSSVKIRFSSSSKPQSSSSAKSSSSTRSSSSRKIESSSSTAASSSSQDVESSSSKKADPVCPEGSYKLESETEYILNFLRCEAGLWTTESSITCSADNIGTRIDWSTPLECTENGWEEAVMECTEETEGAIKVIPSAGYEVCKGGVWVPETMPVEFQSRKML